MTLGQKRAIRELERIQVASQGDFELVDTPHLDNDHVRVQISLRLGVIERREGGLDLREREDFLLRIPPDFPFDYPRIFITDDRFSTFSHVIWSRWICLYQSKLEWNPADGLYGFFDRFRKWLWKAAINDMDPLEGPLEPPHHVTAFSQVPFVIKCNAPVAPRTPWCGLAELATYSNRIELIGWTDSPSHPLPESHRWAFAVILSQPLPMQFPRMGADLFEELGKQDVNRDQILLNLAIASLFTKEGDPIHLVVGLPMRRATDGSPRIHVAVWSTPTELLAPLRGTLPSGTDTNAIRSIRQDLSEVIFSLLKKREIVWCQVMEDRPEIIVRRDRGTSLEWFAGKRVLVLGCGALGSWIAEMLARSNLKALHVLDNAIVKPGVLTRQNYLPADIGSAKADALSKRLRSVTPQLDIMKIEAEAHSYITKTPHTIHSYDVIIDCTASNIFQMKMERDWPLHKGRTPPFISMITDSKASQCLCVSVNQNSTGGIWDAYVRLKHWLCTQIASQDLISAFYPDNAMKGLFQPEPGCSDPTFSGSIADVCCLASAALNMAAEHLAEGHTTIGAAFAAHTLEGRGEADVGKLIDIQETIAGDYRVRIAKTVYREVRACVRRNNRLRSRNCETGGLLWGYWDDAVRVIWIFDASGPPPDSQHASKQFVCGVEGTSEEHKQRMMKSRGMCGFVGFWHTHPNMASCQSIMDIEGMADIVSRIGQNQRRSVMMIFGQTKGQPTATLHIYESHSALAHEDLLAIGVGEALLEESVV